MYVRALPPSIIGSNNSTRRPSCTEEGNAIAAWRDTHLGATLLLGRGRSAGGEGREWDSSGRGNGKGGKGWDGDVVVGGGEGGGRGGGVEYHGEREGGRERGDGGGEHEGGRE